MRSDAYILRCLCLCICTDVLSGLKFSLPVSPVLLILQSGFQACGFHPGAQLPKLFSLQMGGF